MIILDTDMELEILDPQSIETVLYYPKTKYMNPENAHHFDKYELVFVYSDPHLRPWSMKA